MICSWWGVIRASFYSKCHTMTVKTFAFRSSNCCVVKQCLKEWFSQQICQVWGYTPQTPIIANTLDHTKPMLIMIQKVSKSNATACMQCNICEWSKWTLFFPKKLMEKRNIVFMNFLHLFSRHFIPIKWQIVGWVRCSWSEACI